MSYNKQENVINEEQISSYLKDVLSRVESDSDPDSLNTLKKLFKKNIPFWDDIYKKVEVLSPGERSRVALAKVALKGANTLLLDEPTNHLDPMTQVIIADTFKTYEGTMLVVSHNLDFVDNLGISRMLLLPSGKIVYYDRDIVYHYEMINENK